MNKKDKSLEENRSENENGFCQVQRNVRAEIDDLIACFEPVDSEARDLFVKIAKLLIEYNKVLYIDNVLEVLELVIGFEKALGIKNKHRRH